MRNSKLCCHTEINVSTGHDKCVPKANDKIELSPNVLKTCLAHRIITIEKTEILQNESQKH
jgi:hypothetical protein